VFFVQINRILNWIIYIIKIKLVGRVESIHQQRKWRYGFSHYTTGRVGDRLLARAVPRSG